ncbi:hypothetical protein CACET_c20020 [Clostridium aceticum]|uniref:Uncharacterized protein n=1 Tax=Clostridium aceticum TaxID=84022 RepID=A0A0D8I6T2_9CLOT|nr:DUF2756 domain-containing protein [Clostridium aceticum]AKL95450.1 hypothetical protein CACET_c20020 [Clostridium aceticum]KJF25938.1 hypothetical protein TZ02_15595 [Clostridium aceticum]
MKYFSIQSLVIGIGIGMIITAIMNMVFITQPIHSLENQNNEAFIKATSNERISEKSQTKKNQHGETNEANETSTESTINMIEEANVTQRVYQY